MKDYPVIAVKDISAEVLLFQGELSNVLVSFLKLLFFLKYEMKWFHYLKNILSCNVKDIRCLITLAVYSHSVQICWRYQAENVNVSE